ncbi:GIY-YIG nuclease family protein [Streptomyces sp. NPDC059786]|uniref:GIY-YIG nuclease family protein n=1 Tax=Streptomyces sp. NPDC059786 TaxID=3346946 RepID=UPI003652308B
MHDVAERTAFPWFRFNGPDGTAARFLASAVRTEINTGNWKAGQRMPGCAWLAERGRVSTVVADAAIAQLQREGLIAPDSDSAYLIRELPTRLVMTGSLYGVVYDGRALDAIELAEQQAAFIVPPVTDPPPVAAGTESAVAVEPPEQSPAPPSARKAVSTYLLGIENLAPVKIGRTTVSPQARMSALQTGQPLLLSLLWHCRGDYEPLLHARFDPYRVRGEWFDLTPLGDPVEVVKAAVEEIDAVFAETGEDA